MNKAINQIDTDNKPNIADDEVKKPKKRSSRIMNIVQYEEYLSEEKIKFVVSSYRLIKDWCYIKHDKDISFETGEIKKPHFHIVLRFDASVAVDYVAKWFDIPPNFIDTPKGKNSFLNCVQYLTHESEKEQAKGKYLYPDEEVFSNINWRDMLIDYEVKKLDKTNLSPKERWRVKVMEGMRLKDIPSDSYSIDFTQLDNCRLKYIKEFAPMPSLRLNFYVSGGAGAGKGLISRAIARRIIDPNGLLSDVEIFFQVGSGANRFASYDGQPVLIWNDFRASALLEAFNNNRGALFNAFDIHPQPSQENVKYSSVKLINTINVVNSVQDFNDFKDVICGDEDKNQAHRRFPFFVGLNEEDYDLWVNKAFFDRSSREFSQYVMTRNIGASFAKIVNDSSNNPNLRRKIENKVLTPINDAYQRVVDNHNPKEMTEEEEQEILARYDDSNLELNFEDVPIEDRKTKQIVQTNKDWENRTSSAWNPSEYLQDPEQPF